MNNKLLIIKYEIKYWYIYKKKFIKINQFNTIFLFNKFFYNNKIKIYKFINIK